MAGIILDINDDIKRLQQLKAEIESVKKALTSINVKVDIDIAKGLEARLQKLTGQYDALVGKIAASEAKVKEAESRMNSATQRIMEAQERIAKSAGSQGGTSASSASAGVQAQARAYEELERQIDGVLGTRDENVRLMVEEQNAIRILNAQIKEVRKNYTGSDGIVSQRGLQLLEKYNNDLLTHKAALSQVRQELLNQAKLNNAAGTSMNALSQSLSRMRIAYRELTEEERKSPFGQELLASIQQADAKIKELDATIGNHQRNVGNYASGFNSLGMSVQQIVRELPAATMGLNMFFLAISNNLPILTDEIKRAVEMNKQLKASNQDTVPVWKQLVSSIFSWQTALIVAITAMSMYGKEIVSWIGNLFKAKDATEEVRIEQEKLNKSMADARKSAAEETAGLRTLYAMTQNQNASMQDRLAAVNKLQQQYPAYFGNISKEAILAGQASAAYQQLTKDIMAAAYARAYQDRISDLASKNIDNYNKSLSEYNYLITRKGAYDAAKAYVDSAQGKADRNQYVIFSTRTNGGVDFDPEAVARYEKYTKIIEDFEEHRSRWQRHNENYKRNEAVMADYDEEILKRQSALMKTEQGSDYVKDTKSQENEAKRIAKERERIAKERLKAQSDVDKDLLSLQQKNQDDEIALMRDGTQKKLAEIDNDYKKRIAEIDKQEAEFKKKNQEAGATGLTGGLTKEQQDALQTARDNAAKEQERQTNEIYLAEAQAMRDYLKQYGTFQQQKLAIAEEYAEKIKNAQSEGERMSLEKEREQAVANVNLSAIRQDVDWAGVFSTFGTMFQDEIKRNLDALRDIMKSDGFKAMSPTDQAQIVEAVDSLREQVTGDLKDVDFKKIGELTVEFQNAQRKMIAAQAAEAVAYDNLKKAQADYEQALRNGTAEEQVAAKERLDMAKTAADGMSAAYKGAVGEFNATGNNLKDATDNAVDAINSISSAISQIRSGSLSGAFEGVKNLSGTLGKSLSNMPGLLGRVGNALSNFSSTLGGATGEIAGAVLGLLDLLKDGLGSIFADLSDLMFGAVNGILDDIFSGGIITKPVKSLVDGLGGILDTVTFGGFSSWGNNTAETKETIDRLTTRNDALIDSLDRLNDTMKEANGAAESVAAAEQAKKYQQEVNENYRDIAAARAGYQGKHHSWSKYFNDWLEKVGLFDGLDSVVGNKAASLLGIDDKDLETWRKMNDIAGFKVTSRSDFLSITPEQMAEMLADVDIRELIESIGKGGYGAKMLDTLEDYADQAGKIEEIDNSLRETLTQISFDSMYDSFIDTLMDMDASAEDFADDFSEYMMRALLSNQVGTMFKDRLQEWYTAFAEAMEDGDLASGELDSLRDEWDKIVADAMAERDKLAEATGYDNTSSSTSQQQASSKGFETMSQDMAGELSGRFTALNETGLRIEAQGNVKMQTLADLKGSVAGLEVQVQGFYNIADETRSILANSYLELQEINENTGNSAKYLKDIKTDIAIVKQNTSRI